MQGISCEGELCSTCLCGHQVKQGLARSSKHPAPLRSCVAGTWGGLRFAPAPPAAAAATSSCSPSPGAHAPKMRSALGRLPGKHNKM